jgi:hypothetical protein
MALTLVADTSKFALHVDEPIAGLHVQLISHNQTSEVAQLPTGEDLPFLLFPDVGLEHV